VCIRHYTNSNKASNFVIGKIKRTATQRVSVREAEHAQVQYYTDDYALQLKNTVLLQSVQTWRRGT